MIRRTAVRVGSCSIPYLAVACLLAAFGDERLLNGFGFWWCVVAIPTGGLLLDLARLWRARRLGLDAPAA